MRVPNEVVAGRSALVLAPVKTMRARLTERDRAFEAADHSVSVTRCDRSEWHSILLGARLALVAFVHPSNEAALNSGNTARITHISPSLCLVAGRQRPGIGGTCCAQKVMLRRCTPDRRPNSGAYFTPQRLDLRPVTFPPTMAGGAQ